MCSRRRKTRPIPSRQVRPRDRSVSRYSSRPRRCYGASRPTSARVQRRRFPRAIWRSSWKPWTLCRSARPAQIAWFQSRNCCTTMARLASARQRNIRQRLLRSGFRLEAVSQGEHLRRIISDARAAHDDLARERVRRGLRTTLRALKQSAQSFGELEVAAFFDSRAAAALQLDAPALTALDEVAGVLAQPGAAASSLVERIRALTRARTSGSLRSAAPTPATTIPLVPTLVAPTPVASSTIAPPTSAPQERIVPAVQALAGPSATQLRRLRPCLGALLDTRHRQASASLCDGLQRTPVAVEEQPPYCDRSAAPLSSRGARALSRDSRRPASQRRHAKSRSGSSRLF